MVEQRTCNAKVVGSKPAIGTIYGDIMQDFLESFFEWCILMGCVIGALLAIIIPLIFICLVGLGLYTAFGFIFG